MKLFMMPVLDIACDGCDLRLITASKSSSCYKNGSRHHRDQTDISVTKEGMQHRQCVQMRISQVHVCSVIVLGWVGYWIDMWDWLSLIASDCRLGSSTHLPIYILLPLPRALHSATIQLVQLHNCSQVAVLNNPHHVTGEHSVSTSNRVPVS